MEQQEKRNQTTAVNIAAAMLSVLVALFLFFGSKPKSTTVLIERMPGTEREAVPVKIVTAEERFVLNTSSHKFHFPDCTSVSSIKEKNRAEFMGTRDAVMNMGYSPCGNCRP